MCMLYYDPAWMFWQELRAVCQNFKKLEQLQEACKTECSLDFSSRMCSGDRGLNQRLHTQPLWLGREAKEMHKATELLLPLLLPLAKLHTMVWMKTPRRISILGV